MFSALGGGDQVISLYSAVVSSPLIAGLYQLYSLEDAWLESSVCETGPDAVRLFSRGRVYSVVANTVSNLTTVNNYLEALQESYSEVPVEDHQKVVPTDEFDELVDQNDYIGGAYAWVVRDPTDAASVSESFRYEPGTSRRVLFYLPRASDTWGLPGGGQEGAESFAEAAVREVREETGVQCEVTGLWLLRRLEWVSEETDDDRSTYSIQVFFDARYTGGTITIQPGEANGAAWFANLPPVDRMSPANQTRAKTWTADT